VNDDPRGRWVKGLAHWREGGTAFISAAFTWILRDAAKIADYYGALGCRVRAGGPAIWAVRNKIATGRHFLSGKVELGGDAPDAVNRHNPMATRASSGCDQNCVFCMVPAFEGRKFTLHPEFTVRPVLIDNNLSGLPIDYQRYVVDRYQGHGTRIADANSGFEPQSFDEDCFQRWRVINDGPWRFGFDETRETDLCEKVFAMLRKHRVPAKKVRPYVIIGNEPFEPCMERIRKAIEWGGEPHVQPYMKLNAEERKPWAQHDWTEQKLRDVARWANGRLWRKIPFSEYDRFAKKPRADRYRQTDGLFV
jgi:hypothetical protein